MTREIQSKCGRGHKCWQIIKPGRSASLDPSQFSNCSNRATTVHTVLTHLEQRDAYARVLYIDFSSASNTIIPQGLMGKRLLLGLNPTVCRWILDFLTERPQSVCVGKNMSTSITLNTGYPKGKRTPQPFAVTLLTHDLAPRYEEETTWCLMWAKWRRWSSTGPSAGQKETVFTVEA